MRKQLLEQKLGGWIVSWCGRDRHALEEAEEGADPGMIFFSLEAAKGLAKSQVSDHIHCEKVQPVRHIQQGASPRALSRTCVLMNFGN